MPLEQLRTLLIVGMCVVLFLMWQQWRIDYGPAPTEAPSVTREGGGEVPAAAPATLSEEAGVPEIPSDAIEDQAAPVTTAPSVAERDVVRVRTDVVNAEIDLAGGESNVTIDLHSLSSDEQFRDRYIRQVMFPSSPTASFTVDGIEGVAESLSEGETITRSVEGVLSIRGIEAPLTFEVEARLDGEVLHVLGRTTFTWEQLEIPVPTARSVVSLADEVRVEVLLRATPVAR